MLQRALSASRIIACCFGLIIWPAVSGAIITDTAGTANHAASSQAWIKTRECVHYDDSKCMAAKEHGAGNLTATSSHCQPQEKECPTAGDDGTRCYAVWTFETDPQGKEVQYVKHQGCFGKDVNSCGNNSQCVASAEKPPKHYFCCCMGNNCNSEFRYEPSVESEENTTAPPLIPPPVNLHLVLYLLIPVIITILIAGAVVYVYRQRKSSQFSSLSQSEEGPPALPTPNTIHRPIQLLEIKARGRFGAVWKGRLAEKTVAVKIFPLQDKQSWFAEQEIYNLPQMSHPNILQFLGVDKRGESLQLEFWLVTAFHERGSLCDYLKGNTVSLSELCQLSLGIAAGLTHLHTEIPANATQKIKPAIAHRDFKSKNVLIKADMTACIGDFGLALQFKPNEIVGDTHGQVGTRRYMAPEVLEGAINFSRDAFLRIDMYACGLVLWEVLSRCRQLQHAQQYKMPFEAETRSHPSLEEISDLVVMKKARPQLKDSWRSHGAMSILCETIEECWDHDAEARLSASCVLERLQLLQSTLHAMDSLNADEETRLTTQEALNNTLNVQVQQQSFQPPGTQFIMQSLNGRDTLA